MGLKVNEVFHSIQGESSFAGQPCVFVRLAGCNLRCSYCDTRYAYEDGRTFEVDEILEAVSRFECGLVEITGGEPLLQEQTPELAARLLAAGYTVLVETNGSLDIDIIDRGCARIVDIKCPSSGMAEKNDPRNIEKLTERDELKFVLGSREDYEFAKKILETFPAPRCKINFSAVFGENPPCPSRIKSGTGSLEKVGIDAVSLAEWILEDRLPVRLNLQLHKIIWGPDARGK